MYGEKTRSFLFDSGDYKRIEESGLKSNMRYLQLFVQHFHRIRNQPLETLAKQANDMLIVLTSIHDQGKQNEVN